MIWQLARIFLVLALVCVAAVLAMPPGRLPLALRGVLKLLRQDRGRQPETVALPPVSSGRRLVALALVLAALALAIL